MTKDEAQRRRWTFYEAVTLTRQNVIFKDGSGDFTDFLIELVFVWAMIKMRRKRTEEPGG